MGVIITTIFIKNKKPPFFVEEENYRSKEVSIKIISLEQYRRCAIEGSKNIINDHIQREIYFNSVRSMEIILFPEILKRADIKQQIKENEDKLEALEKEYKQHYDDLKQQAKNGRIVNKELLRDTYERKLITIYQEKLIIIGLLLKELNYYDELGVYIES